MIDEFKVSEDIIIIILRFSIKLESVNEIDKDLINEIEEKYDRVRKEIYKILDFDDLKDNDMKNETFQEMFNIDDDFKISEDVRLTLNFSFKLFSENRIDRIIKKEIREKYEKICDEIGEILISDAYSSREEE